MVFAVSVTLNLTCLPSLMRTKLPCSTKPPMRKFPSLGASPCTTCVGVKKNTKLLLNDLRINAVAMPSTKTPAAISAKRL